MKKILAVFAVIILAVAAGCYGYYVKAVVPKEAYEKAEKAFASEDYDAALDAYKEAGDYKDSTTKIKMITAYEKGLSLMEEGSLKKAAKKFEKALSYGDDIDCSKLRDLCSEYGDFRKTLKASYKVERTKENAYDYFGGYSAQESTDIVLHLNVKITQEGKVEYLAYADTSTKDDNKAYQTANYVRSSNKYEWTIMDPSEDYSSVAYSYDANENYLKISYYNKKGGRIVTSEKNYF